MSKHSTLKVSEHHLMSSLIKLFDCHLSKLIEGAELKGQSEHELNPLFEGKYENTHVKYFSRIKNFSPLNDLNNQYFCFLIFRNVLFLLHMVDWSRL